IWDLESSAKQGNPPQIVAGLFGSRPVSGQATVIASQLQGHTHTVQVPYTSGKDGLVTLQFWNYSTSTVTFMVDQSGLRYPAIQGSGTDHTYVPIVMQLSGAQSTAPLANTPPAAPVASACEFLLGFQVLHDMSPGDIGDCLGNQVTMPNGDAQQHTTKGLLVWRKIDNAT